MCGHVKRQKQIRREGERRSKCTLEEWKRKRLAELCRLVPSSADEKSLSNQRRGEVGMESEFHFDFWTNSIDGLGLFDGAGCAAHDRHDWFNWLFCWFLPLCLPVLCVRMDVIHLSC